MAVCCPGGVSGRADLSVGDVHGAQIGVEGIGLDLEIAAQLGQGGRGLFAGLLKAAQRLLPSSASGTVMLRVASTSSTSVAACFLVSV